MLSIHKNSLFLIIFLADDVDHKYIKDYLLQNKISDKDINDFFSDKIKKIDKIDFEEITINQRLLLMAYFYLYVFLKTNTLSNDKLSKITSIMNISNEYSTFLQFNYKRIDHTKILKEKKAINIILEPTPKIKTWIANIVYTANRKGSFIKKKVLTGLDSKRYEHYFDKKALETLEDTPGLEIAVRKFNQYGIERYLKIQYTGSNIKVSKKNFPQLFNILLTACRILDIKKIPDLYIDLGFINAWTVGVEKPVIVITSGCVGLLSYEELLFVIGHELGHIKSQHVLYHQMAAIISDLGTIIGQATLGIGGLISKGLEFALLNWARKSEFTADRAGLLACQNINSAITAMMKIAGVPPRYYKLIKPEDFLNQAAEFEDLDFDSLNKIVKSLSVMSKGHPWTVMRAAEMNKWIKKGEYDRIINSFSSKEAKKTKKNMTNTDKSFCKNCGKQLQENIKFCTNCGSKR